MVGVVGSSPIAPTKMQSGDLAKARSFFRFPRDSNAYPEPLHCPVLRTIGNHLGVTMPVDNAIAKDTRIAELLRKADLEKKMAEQLKSQSRLDSTGKLQSEIAAHSARADQARRDALG